MYSRDLSSHLRFRLSKLSFIFGETGLGRAANFGEDSCVVRSPSNFYLDRDLSYELGLSLTYLFLELAS